MTKSDSFSEIIFYFNIDDIRRMWEAQTFVMDIDKIFPTDYLTGIIVSLSLKKKRLGIRTVFEKEEIPNYDSDKKFYTDSLENLVSKHRPDNTIKLDTLELSEWESANADFRDAEYYVSLASFAIEDTFAMFRETLQS